ncbi:protein kinase [bacterium]|nr:protein kinase [bacterium]
MRPHGPDTDDTSSEEKDTEYSPPPTHALQPDHTDTDLVEETRGREIPSDLDYLILGKYRLIKLLGKGGMGDIYLAEHTDLRKLVAIKIISKKLSYSQQFINLFKREARSAAKLQHPNIARVFDYGEERGKWFYVMDYIEGHSLGEIIDSSAPLSVRRALAIFKQILEALHAAHKSGIIHRDIKPNNILIDQSGLVKLLDFGLARSIYGDDSLTAAGQSPGGTPSYSSPEQRKGEPTDARTDIYSAGVTLFEMLTGTLPRDVNSPHDELVSVLGKSLNPFQRVRAFHITNMVMKCLDDVSKRYATAEKALEEVEKIERRLQQQRWFVRSAAGALVAAGLAVAAVLLFNPKRSQASDAVKYLGENEFSKAAKLFAELSRKNPSDLKSSYGLGLSYLGMQKLNRAELEFRKLAKSFGDGTTADEEGLARVAYARNDRATAMDLFNKAVETGKDHTLIHVTIGDIYLLQNQLDRAIEKYKRALDRKPMFRFQLAAAYAGLGKAYARQGELDEGLKALRKAEEVRPSDAEIAAARGYVLMKQGEYQKALKAVEKAAKMNPDDNLAVFLQSEIARRADAKADAASQNRISNYVDDLIEKAKQARPLPSPEETWQSKPLSLAILDLKKADFAFSREGEYEMLMFNFARAMQETQRVSLVEREVLEELLRELKLGTSDLADARVAPTLGKIVPAGLIATGTLRGDTGRFGVDIRLAETETTKLSIFVSQTQKEGESISEFAERLAKRIAERIRETYPLKAKIIKLSGKEAIVNVGSKHGLSPGTQMKVIKRQPEQVGGSIVYRETEVGRLTVRQVNPDFATAEIVEGDGAVSNDDWVIEIVKKGTQ